MSVEETKQPSQEPEEKDLDLVLVKPEDTSDKALWEAAQKLYQALQELRAKRLRAKEE